MVSLHQINLCANEMNLCNSEKLQMIAPVLSEVEEEAQVVQTIRYKWLQKAYVFKEAIHTMKKSIILIPALLMLGLMLVSCSSEPQTTTTTTRQTTVTSAPPLLMAKTHTRPLSGQPAMDAGSY